MSNLAEHTGKPTLFIKSNGKEWGFSELSIEKLADIQSWMIKNVPHPITAIKPYLTGLEDQDRRYLLDQARKDAMLWPPDPRTSHGASLLVASEAGQIEALRVGLSVHHANEDIGEPEARAIFRALVFEAAKESKRAKKAGIESDGQATVNRIYAIMFGLPDPATEEDDDPKA